MSANVLRDLRDLRVQVIHPPDDEGKSLVEHLRRIGCTVEANWPVPESPSGNADVLMVVIEYDQREAIRKLLRGQGDRSPPLIAIVDYENPTTLQIVLECGALAVTEKPIRPFGLLTNVILARTLWLERQAVGRKMRKLESKLSGIQRIQRAKANSDGVSRAQRGRGLHDHPQAGHGQAYLDGRDGQRHHQRK